ncbi:MAG: VOC family protein [Aggregatilineales bacterium]
MLIRKIDAAVLFVQYLDRCMIFYRDMLGLQVTFSDSVSFAFRLEDQDFVLLKVSAAAQMVGEEVLSLHTAAGHRVLLCASVEDVDAVYKALTAKGVAFIKPPISQRWGRRTAYFADPEGNLWEIWHSLASEQQK